MRLCKRMLCTTLILILLIQSGVYMRPNAAVNPPQPAPENLRAKEIGVDTSDASAAKSYVDLQWDVLKTPDNMPNLVGKYINFYVQEINKPYKPSKPLTLKERDVSGSSTSLRMRNLMPGTIYYINARAYYTYNEGNATYVGAESESSNTVKILTDIQVAAYSYGTNQIKIEWDDVWDSGRRMNYKLYVSENSTFTNTSPIYIGREQIGSNGPVTVNQTSGKLEYIHAVRDPGRVYYVKIVPDTAETGMVMNPETKTVAVSSFIVVKTTKMSATDAGTIWRLEWRPVITGLTGSDIKINYQIDKFVNDVPLPMLIEEGTSTFIIVPPGTENNYYVVRALVTRNGVPVYPGVKIESDRVVVKEQEVPSTPASPELVDVFNDSYNDPIVSYDDILDEYGRLVKKGGLTSNSATLLWRVPKKADGSIDSDITYDIWLINDSNTIDYPPADTQIASSIKMTNNNFVMDGTEIIGYKYTVNNLTANSTYYFKIVAKKTYTEYVDDSLQSVEYASLPALKVIITQPEGPVDQPLVPSNPPLSVKRSLDNNELITDTAAVIQMKNKWYEEFKDGRWQYIRSEKLSENDMPPYNPYNPDTLPDGRNYRMVGYDEGVTLDVGCIKFVEGMTYDDLFNLPANKVRGFPVTPNDPYEDPAWNAPEQVDPLVYKKHNVDIVLTGLEPNTTYVIWVRASRESVNLTSGPSDPIIITTDPVVEPPVERPVIPQFDYSQAGDTFIDLGWEVKNGYNYYLKYGTTDDISKATGSASVSAADLLYSTSHRINGLSSNTLYYFWIQAEASGDTEKIQSEWSDSYAVKTLKDTPPDTPRGFGIKNGEEAVTKDSIIFEWLKEDNLEYILEVAGDTGFHDAREYRVGNTSEIKVEGLLSNHRYYARLYAYDPEKDLKSQPTQSIAVKTGRSGDDYDSDQDVENVISGNFVVKDPAAVNGIWNIKITGVNSDRFIEHILNDNILDYKIDAGKPPAGTAKIRILISSKVFDALTGLKENLAIDTAAARFVIRPGTLDKELAGAQFRAVDSFDYQVLVSFPSTASYPAHSGLILKAPVVDFSISAGQGSNVVPVTRFGKPLRVIFPYDGDGWFNDGITSAYIYDNKKSEWNKVETLNTFNTDSGKGYIRFETPVPGRMLAADSMNSFFDDIYGHTFENSIIRVASVHNLKSINGRMFEPDRYASVSDTVKFMLDIMDYNYSSDFMAKAVKAGIISSSDAGRPAAGCSREKAIAMAVRIYEIKTGEQAEASNISTSRFNDLNQVDPQLLPKINFAIENGLVIGRKTNLLAPRDTITRGELLGLLEKLLALAGEIG